MPHFGDVVNLRGALAHGAALFGYPCHMPFLGGGGGFLDSFVDAGWWDGPSAFEQEQVAGLPGRAVGDPGVR